MTQSLQLRKKIPNGFYRDLSAIVMGTAIASTLVITLPQAASALTGQEINNIAREVTVLVVVLRDGEQVGHGSGVIIARNDNTYYALTNDHVASGEQDYVVRTADEEMHRVSNVKTVPNGVDLAVVEFTSEENYPIAQISPAQTSEGQQVFVSGLPVQDFEQGIIRQFTSGSISGFLKEPVLGYQISYTNVTRAGMSGGPVFDTGGRVIAIHGLGGREGPRRVAADIGLSEEQAQGLAKLISTGFNYSIPINRFLQLAPQAGIYLNLQVDSSSAPELGQPYVANSEPDSRDVIDNLNEDIDKADRGVNVIERGANTVCRLFGC